jgi:hypothetical protein
MIAVFNQRRNDATAQRRNDAFNRSAFNRSFNR